jgi:predicted nucleic acid-binding Zn ribbon protein
MAEMSHAIQCAGCGRDAHRVYSPPTIRFIGPGFHNTDYRKGKKREDKEQPTPQETKAKADASTSSTPG